MRARKSRDGPTVGRNEELDELIAAFDRLVHDEHPNPERVACPESATLARLATESGPLGTDAVLDHVRQCAACLDELRDLRLARKPPLQRS